MTQTDKAPEKTDLVSPTIDGVQVSVPKDTLVIRAAVPRAMSVRHETSRREDVQRDCSQAATDC